MNQNFWIGFEKQATIVSSVVSGFNKLKKIPGQLAQRGRNEVLKGQLAAASNPIERQTVLNAAKAKNIAAKVPRQQALSKSQMQLNKSQAAYQGATPTPKSAPSQSGSGLGWKAKAGLGAAAIGVPAAAAYTMGAANAVPQYDQAPQRFA
jgi:hypothetical protein